jgi:hypothetical protein
MQPQTVNKRILVINKWTTSNKVKHTSIATLQLRNRSLKKIEITDIPVTICLLGRVNRATHLIPV